MGGQAASEGIPAEEPMTLATGVQCRPSSVGRWCSSASGVTSGLCWLHCSCSAHPSSCTRSGSRATRWASGEMIQFNKVLALTDSALAFFQMFQRGVDFTITGRHFS